VSVESFSGEPLPNFSRSDRRGSGGFSDVFQDPNNSGRLIKVFKTPLVGQAAERVIRLLRIENWARPSDSERFLSRFAWPLECFGRPEEITGFSMAEAPPGYWFELQVGRKTDRKLLQVKFLSDANYWRSGAVHSDQPEFSESLRRELAIDIFESLGALHRNGLVYGDISSNNICACVGQFPRGFFLDADSIGLPEELEGSDLLTPDWRTPENLDPFEKSVSLASLLSWRLMTEAATSYPEMTRVQEFQGKERERFGKMLEVYESGRLTGLEDLAQLFRSHRTDEMQAEALNQAAGTKLARNVLREAVAVTRLEHRAVVETAQKQMEFEDSIDAAPRKERLKILGRGSALGSSFNLDVFPESSSSLRPTSVGQLRDLIFDARFEDLAMCIAERGLGPLEADSWLPQAVQHALIHIEVPAVTTVAEPGRTKIQWEWPNVKYVTAGILYIRATGYDNIREVIPRYPGDQFGFAEVACEDSMKGYVYLRLAVKSPTGRPFVGSLHSEKSFVSLPMPKPRRATQVPLSTENDVPRNSLQVVDPVVEAERLRLKREAIRKFRRRKVLLGVSTTALLVFLSWIGWNLLTPKPVPTQVVFASDRDGDWEIYVSGSTYNQGEKLTDDRANNKNPEWSHSGDLILFETDRTGNWEIALMDLAELEIAYFTQNDFEDRDPTWAKSGELVLFASDRDGDWEIYSTGQGGQPSNLTNNSVEDRNPQWSPDLDLIVFESYRDGNWDIVLMDLSGEELDFFSDSDSDERDPTWAKSGELVLFASDRDGDWEIYSTELTGDGDNKLTDNKFDDRNPQWSPNGDSVVFASMQDGDWEIMRMETNGSETGQTFKVYTQNNAQDVNPSWVPNNN
jgi:Tol biopolymer transport system component